MQFNLQKNIYFYKPYLIYFFFSFGNPSNFRQMHLNLLCIVDEVNLKLRNVIDISNRVPKIKRNELSLTTGSIIIKVWRKKNLF